MVRIAFQVRNLYKKETISIYSCSTLKPFNFSGLRKIFKRYKKILIIEDHSIVGGLNEIIKNYAFDADYKGDLFSFSLKDEFIHSYGSQDDLLEKHGISVKKILKKLK